MWLEHTQANHLKLRHSPCFLYEAKSFRRVMPFTIVTYSWTWCNKTLPTWWAEMSIVNLSSCLFIQRMKITNWKNTNSYLPLWMSTVCSRRFWSRKNASAADFPQSTIVNICVKILDTNTNWTCKQCGQCWWSIRWHMSRGSTTTMSNWRRRKSKKCCTQGRFSPDSLTANGIHQLNWLDQQRRERQQPFTLTLTHHFQLIHGRGKENDIAQ